MRLRAGDPQSAIGPLEAALRLRPDVIQVRMLLADAYLAVGRSEEAASLIREHIKQTPQDSQSYLVLGMILKKQKKNDESREAFEKALKLNPENVVAIDQLADLDLEAESIFRCPSTGGCSPAKRAEIRPCLFHPRQKLCDREKFCGSRGRA